MTHGRILFVDDDSTFRRVMSRELTRVGFTVHSLPSAEGGLEALKEHEPEAALLDLNLPGKSGLELLRELRAADPELQAVMLTGHGAVPEAVQAMRDGAHDFLTKPASLDVVEQALLRAVEKRRLLVENQRLRRAASSSDDPQAILGDSARVQQLREVITRVAKDDSHVLIQGENGTGKELVARNIHRQSARREHPFVVVSCGAIPPNLVESELFGHERGAFTGADRKRTGWFEAAAGGTLFLDEIGELPLAVQPALLRATQFGEFRPVGSTRERTVNVRVLAATNRDLEKEVAQGRFRQDLYYRLATLLVEVPPLRARAEDVPLLARWFLTRAEKRCGRKFVLEDKAAATLMGWQWPGNIRELENVITRLSVLSPGDTITTEVLQQYGLRTPTAQAGDLPSLRVDELERLAIIRALERTQGDKRMASEMLGIALRTLYNKLDVYGLKNTLSRANF